MKGTNYKTHPGNIVITVIAVIVAIAGACYFIRYWRYSTKYEETNDAQVESYINPISARAGGYIKRVCFDEHQLVKQGDTLVMLDDREYRAQLDAAGAAVEDVHAQLTVLSANIHAAEISTSVNHDQINGARARYIQQEQDIKRYTNLVKEEAVTGADLELARLNLSYTVIRAPYSGRLGRKNILEGQQIQPGQSLVSIINEQEKWITANYKETQVAEMYVGQPVDIRVDAIANKVFKGKIVAIAGSTGARFSLLPPDNSTGNFVKIIQRVPVKIMFESKESGDVIAGMNVTVAVKKRSQS
ncbi:HlyD family secretion protein [Chitinophaga filiformis]|uniref:Membrane fusion protein, multidrug efflux system n=1 Tax=Chitinophaga filiformis TaxID=104663 RepID=A0A1G7SB21_CHIFI|nr:HlyD family secretion protein [Chitinophaga filiformis]SDG20245.1 membrane fusion protein, multidrug efflux system [Chitinophaga filiformis]